MHVTDGQKLFRAYVFCYILSCRLYIKFLIFIVGAMARGNLPSELSHLVDSNRHAQQQRLYNWSRHYTGNKAKSKCAYQSARVRRLICVLLFAYGINMFCHDAARIKQGNTAYRSPTFGLSP